MQQMQQLQSLARNLPWPASSNSPAASTHAAHEVVHAVHALWALGVGNWFLMSTSSDPKAEAACFICCTKLRCLDKDLASKSMPYARPVAEGAAYSRPSKESRAACQWMQSLRVPRLPNSSVALHLGNAVHTRPQQAAS